MRHLTPAPRDSVCAAPHPASGHLLPRAEKDIFPVEAERERMEPMLTKEQVAARLGVKPETVAKWANAGRVPVHRVGRRLRFFWSEIRALIVSGEIKGGKI